MSAMAKALAAKASHTSAVALAAVWLSLGTLVVGTIAALVARLEQFTPADSSGLLFLLAWLGSALTLFVLGYGGLLLVANWRAFPASGAYRAAGRAALAAVLLAVVLVNWPPFGSAVAVAG